MASGDAPAGGRIYIPLPPVDPKANLLTRENFVWGVELSGMSDGQCPQYLIPFDFNGNTPHPICKLSEGETTIYLAQIDAGLRISYCEPLKELCVYYDITPTQLTRNAL